MSISNTQRALWSVLITTIAAPFIGGLASAVLAFATQVAGAGLPVFTNMPVNVAAVSGFLWSALPALVASVGLVPYILQKGGYDWLHGAAAGVVGFAAGVFVSSFEAGGLLPVLAFISGLVMLAVRAILIRAKILLPTMGPV